MTQMSKQSSRTNLKFDTKFRFWDIAILMRITDSDDKKKIIFGLVYWVYTLEAILI